MEKEYKEAPDTLLRGKAKTAASMEEVATEFKKIYSAYYRDQTTDEQLMQYTTQPFWQSMGLSKRRLRDKGLTLEIDMIKDISNNSSVFRENFKVDKRPVKYKMHVESDGQCEAGQCRENVLVRRIFRKDGKRIYKKVESEQHVATCLKYKTEGDQAVCPNCGYVGTVSSFMDGCDACGSKFTVHDFEPKISGFSFEQNEYTRLRSFTGSINGMLWCVFLLTMLVCAAFICIAPYFQNAAWMGYAAKMVILGFLSMFVGVVVLCLFGTISSLITYIVQSAYDKNIGEEDIAIRTVRNISVNDFFQNLEYKIRNIHFAKNEQETRGFAKCGLADVLRSYEDVIDCNMIKLTFTDGRRTEDGYHLDCLAKIRKTTYTGKKIRYVYENVQIGVDGKKGVVDKPVTVMNLYICKNCGSTLNLLEGASCRACGNQYALEDYDWVIDHYETQDKKSVWPVFVRIGAIILYLVIVLGTICALPIDMKRITVGGVTVYDETTETEELQEITEQAEE